jgi:hypothetical protein
VGALLAQIRRSAVCLHSGREHPTAGRRAAGPQRSDVHGGDSLRHLHPVHHEPRLHLASGTRRTTERGESEYCALACGVMIAAAVIATYFPAHRAASIDPTRALRAELPRPSWVAGVSAKARSRCLEAPRGALSLCAIRVRIMGSNLDTAWWTA